MARYSETELFDAWRLLEAIGRGRAATTEQRIEACRPAMTILESQLDAMGFAIVDNELVPKPPPEEPAEEQAPPAPEPEAATASQSSEKRGFLSRRK